MIGLLLTPQTLIDAFDQHLPQAEKAVAFCRETPLIQPWILSSSIELLVAAGLDPTVIPQLLKGITQIPVNVKIVNEALSLAGNFSYSQALALAAVHTFKLFGIVDNGTEQFGETKRLDYGQVLELSEADENAAVRFLDLRSQLHSVYDKVEEWYTEIIQNTAFAGGNHVKAFEEEFARFCETKHAIGVNSGTDALRFALIAMGIGQGDEVITVPNTFIATTEAISQVGAIPVFVDVLPDTYNMNPDLIEAKITAKTKAILPVHLYGQLADMDAILKIANQHGLQVLEDACQAHGARYKGKLAGTFGHAAAFSMYPGKNLGAFGEAGAVVTNDDDIAGTVACLRDHGQNQKYYHKMEGFNGRMDNLQAAALRAKLPFLAKWNEDRRKNAALYNELLTGIPQITLPHVPSDHLPVFHLYIILTTKAKELNAFLKEYGIDSGFHYPVPLNLQEAYADKKEGKGSYPVTEKCAEELLSLPMYPELTERQIRHVAVTIKTFFNNGQSFA